MTFACAMTRRETFEKLGGLEETFLPNAYGDVDMCLRALDAGYRNYYLGSLSGIHHESESRGSTNEDFEYSVLFERRSRTIAAWRLRHLRRSYRHAWPLNVLPWNCPPPLPDNDLEISAFEASNVPPFHQPTTTSPSSIAIPTGRQGPRRTQAGAWAGVRGDAIRGEKGWRDLSTNQETRMRTPWPSGSSSLSR